MEFAIILLLQIYAVTTADLVSGVTFIQCIMQLITELVHQRDVTRATGNKNKS